MSVDATTLTARTGAGLPNYGGAAPPLLRPPVTNLIGGTLPPAIAGFTIGGTGDYAEHAADRLAHARRQLALIAGNIAHVAVFGDSNFKGCPMQLISPFAEQYAISGDDLPGLVARLRENPNPSVGVADYAALSSASAVVLGNFPFNGICVASPNLSTIETNYATLLAYFTGPMVIVPPVANTTTSAWNTNITTFNTWLNSNYSGRANTVIVDVHDITTGVLSDGQHWDGATRVTICNRTAAALRTLLH